MAGLGKQIPPMLVNLGQACYECFKEKSAQNPLQRCTGCLHVHYCGTVCQRANWSKHKALCRAYKAVETNNYHDIFAPYIFLEEEEDSTVASDIDEVNECIGSVAAVTIKQLQRELGRPLRIEERNLVGWEPHCLACGRSDTIFRIEAFARRRTPESLGLKPCSDCHLSFYCSQEHWDAVKVKHKHDPCQDGRDGLSQCSMNQLILQDLQLAQFLSGANAGEFQWAPERTLTSWSTLQGVDWTDFAPGLADVFGRLSGMGPLMDQMLRAMTNVLSMPMTILWGLENLHHDDSWTKKDTLNVHVLGVSEKEILGSQIFEEILHRLPLVKTLRLTFCGPELRNISGPAPRLDIMSTCPECTHNGRQRIQDHHPKTYHDYITSQGSNYVKPDLAIAFDSGCSEEDVDSWKKTMSVLVQRRIPTVFTAFNQEEAEAEAELLRNAGANLHPELGPRSNPWGSLLSKTEPNKVTGFYAINGWLAGGF